MLESCARPETPQGGPKDDDPPILIGSDPISTSTNFNKDMIELEFNEWVQIKNINKELLITPSIPKGYIIESKKNKVKIKKLKLDSAITYTFNFRNGVQDITEKLPAENLVLVFSTGNLIDSISITGQLKNPLNYKFKTANIALYPAIDTLDAFNTEPLYLTEVDSLNNFRIDYVKSGSYQIFGFLDYNGNGKVESKSEPYAFYPSYFHTDTLTTFDNLILSKGNLDEPRITSSRPKEYFFQLAFSKPMDTVFIAYENQDSLLYQWNNEKDKILVYNTQELTEADSLALNIKIKDSIAQTIDTLLYVKFKKYEPKKSNKQTTLNVKKETQKIKNNRLMNVKLKFEVPTKLNELDSIGIYLDSLKIANVNDLKQTWNYNHTQLHIQYKLGIDSLFKSLDSNPISIENTNQEKANYNLMLFFPATSFIGINKDSSNTAFSKLEIIDRDKIASIEGKLSCEKENIILNLLNNNKEIVSSCFVCKDFKFDYLDPGEYYLQIIEDSNGNGKTDLGNYLKKILPENVYTFPASTKLKAGWQLNKVIISCDDL